MTYKQTLFFIAQCLTISLEEKNKKDILLKLNSGFVNWKAVVKVSTEHYVFPALFCNLKKADYLKYLPKDLVLYMQYITNLNRERNQKIITQAKKLNDLLLVNNITPIFLKGTGNLLANLYEDDAERMVGDIDFIVSKDDYLKTIKVLRDNGYYDIEKNKYNFPKHRHYRRIIKKNNIAAVEIHHNLLPEKYVSDFNFNYVEKDSQLINGFKVLSYANKFNLSIISSQINDNGFHYIKMDLRNGYDVFLLSKKTNAKKSFSNLKSLSNPLNCFLAICHLTFGEIDTLEYNKSRITENYLAVFHSLIHNKSKRKLRMKLKYIELFIKERLFILWKSLFDKEYRRWLAKRISDEHWQSEKMIQLGLKKNKHKNA